MEKKLRKKILVVDDDPDIRDNLRMMLTQYGYEVDTTDEANQVIAKTKKNPPDLILMDIWMSGSDGREISRQLKNTEETRDIPIVLVSANSDVEKASKQIGVDFLAKPFEMRQLISKISKYCS